MKTRNIFNGFTIAAIMLIACNSSNNNTGDTSNAAIRTDTITNSKQPSPETKTGKSERLTDNTKFPVKEIIAGYLELKNALTKDDGSGAATAGKAIAITLARIDMKSLPEEQMKKYMDIADDLKENAEHIGANADKIEHQREHFEMLSKDISDMIKTFGNGGQILYTDFCPMASNGKGAIWISEIEKIKNPYLGKKMPDCGSVKETIK